MLNFSKADKMVKMNVNVNKPTLKTGSMIFLF